MKPESHPGIPSNIFGKNIKDVIDTHGEHVVRLVIERLELMFENYNVIVNSEICPLNLVRGLMCDPVKVFLKPEPHSPKKVSEGRWRVIIIMSVVDQLIDRLFCYTQNKTEISYHRDIPSKPGMGFSDQGIAETYEAVRNLKSDDLLESDMKAWDWKVSEDEIMVDFERRSLYWPVHSWSKKCMEVRYKCVSRKVYCLPDGTLLAQTVWGCLPSGWFNTSSTNSFIRAYLAFMRGVDMISNGDDGIEEYNPHIKSWYESLGHEVGMMNRVEPNRFEFCSHLFTSSTAYPVNHIKSLHNLLRLTGPPEARYERTVQWCYEYRNHPRLSSWVSMLYAIGFLVTPTAVSAVGLSGLGNPSYMGIKQSMGLRVVIAQNLHRSVLTKMPNDCTALLIDIISISLLVMYSLRLLFYAYPILKTLVFRQGCIDMPNRQRNKSNVKPKNKKVQKAVAAEVRKVERQSTASVKSVSRLRNMMANLGGVAGAVGGGVLGGPVGAAAGMALGKGLVGSMAEFIGKGDYAIKANSILASGQLPGMHSNNLSIRVRHKEYIGDIITSGTANTFAIQQYALNPGLVNNYPWLSAVAGNFQEYSWEGLIYEFKSTSADSYYSSTINVAMGSVLMATQYRATAPAFTNKTSMLENYFSSDGKPNKDFIHCVECAPVENPYQVQYVRTGNVPGGEDQKTYDLGVFSIATSGFPGTNQVIGELWASYDVKLLKPQLNLSGTSSYLHIWSSSAISATHPWGTSWVTSSNPLGCTITSTSLTFPQGSLNGNYIFLINWGVTTSAGTTVAPAFTSSSNGVNALSAIGSASASNIQSFTQTSGVLVGSSGGFAADSLTCFNVLPTAGVNSVFTVSGGTLGNVTYSDVYVLQIPTTSY